ncbi:cytochrome b-c1 complex subunit 7-2 [Citrus sinensis]|uniref:Cytochrome b-c1 complex subunit 7-2 n=3 Tax=Citrus sinensis TaxID=2711 RepID=A0ACB8NM72_CITSI|nr:cytochrome b-c1 complex subunit 7-2 [Citrus sinensis]
MSIIHEKKFVKLSPFIHDTLRLVIILCVIGAFVKDSHDLRYRQSTPEKSNHRSVISVAKRASERANTKVKMASLLQSLLDPKKNWLAAQHMKTISKRLRNFGLRYDDLYDPYYDLDIKEALDRLPREIVDARNQRLKRAMDLSMKHEYLPEDLQAMQTPFRNYLQDMLALVKREKAEREALGALPLYQRTIP